MGEKKPKPKKLTPSKVYHSLRSVRAQTIAAHKSFREGELVHAADTLGAAIGALEDLVTQLRQLAVERAAANPAAPAPGA